MFLLFSCRGWTHWSWDNQQPGCRNIMIIPVRQTVLTWELESSITDHHTAHWETADNQHFPECTVKHLCVSFSNIYMVRCHAHYYLCTGSCTWCDSVYSTLLYMILWEGAFIKGKSLADAFSKCSVDWCTWMSKLKHSTLGTCQEPQQYLSTQTGHWAVMGV